jgi:hypothetical protein
MPPYLWRPFKSLYRELGWNDNHIEKLFKFRYLLTIVGLNIMETYLRGMA